MYQATLSQLSKAARPLFPDAEDIDEALFAAQEENEAGEQEDPLDFLSNAIQEATVESSPPEEQPPPLTSSPPSKKRRRSEAADEIKLDQIWKRRKSLEEPSPPPPLQETASEPAATESGQDDFVVPERAPNVSCNRLAKAKLDVMFPDKVDLHLLADCQVDEEEEAVCGACLLDLFECDEEAAPPASSRVPEDVRTLRSARRDKSAPAIKPSEPPNEYAPTPQEKVGLISSCLHMYHAECIGKWTQTENACCQCKQRYGFICYYELSGQKSRLIAARKTLQSLSRRNEAIAAEAEAASAEGVCHVCHALGDRESLMHCSRHGCDTMAHFYCLNLERVSAEWRCTDCTITRVPVESPVTIPQPSRRRAHRPATQSSRLNAARNRLREMHNAAARLHAAANEYELPELPPPVRRLLPSEKDTVMHKSNVDDLILGQVSVSELSGHSKRKRPSPKPQPAPARSSLTPSPAKPSSSRPPRPTARPLSSAGCSRAPEAAKAPVLPCSLDAALASIAKLSAHTESRLVEAPKTHAGDDAPKLELSAAPFDPLPQAKQPAANPRPVSSQPSRPVASPAAEPTAARSLTISKRFIDSAVRTPATDDAQVVALQLGRGAVRLKQTPPRFLLGHAATNSSEKQAPLKVSNSGKPSPELITVIENMVESRFPGIKRDLATLFKGNPMGLLRARTALFTKLARDSVGVSLFEGASRSSPRDREKYWQSKQAAILPLLCKHKLLTDATARQDFLRSAR